MEKIAIYRAFDGEDFYTENECREYETNALNCMHEIFDKVQFFDAFMGAMLEPEENDICKYLDVFEAAYYEAPYMDIVKPLSEAAINFIEGYVNVCLPDGVGMFEYDEEIGKWKAAE